MSSSLSARAYIEEPASENTGHIAMDGGLMFWAGLSFGTASFVQYLILSGILTLPNPAMMGLLWMGATVAFILFGVTLKIGIDPLRLRDPAFRRFRAFWGSLILGGAIVIGALMIIMVKFHVGPASAFIVSPIAISVYGIGWRVAAIMTGKRWANFLALGAFASAPLLASLAGSPAQSLTYTACLLIFAVVPGLYLMMRPVR